MKKAYTITVEGKNHKWAFPFVSDDDYLEEWRADGLIVHELARPIKRSIMDRLWHWLIGETIEPAM